MRILQLTDDLAYAGGIQSAVRNTAELLRQHGHQVRIFDPDGGRAQLSRWLGLRYLRQLRRDLQRDPVDLVHAHSLSMRLSPLPLRAAVERRTPVVMTVHDFNYVCPRKWLIDPAGRPCARGLSAACLALDCHSAKRGYRYLPYHDLRWLKIVLHRALLRRLVDVFVAPSQALAERLVPALGLTADRIEQIPNFVPALGAGDHAIRSGVSFVGRLSPEKGVGDLLHAFARVRERFAGLRLTIAGDGPARRSLEALAVRLGVARETVFLGMLGQRAVRDLLATTRCVVFPSLWFENCPMGILEAMAAGAPILASRTGGIPELVRDGETGLLFERGDASQFASQLTRILAEPALGDQLSDAAAAAFERQFSPQAHLPLLSRLYDRCLEGRYGGRR